MDTRINKVGRRDLEKEVSVPKKKMKLDESLLQENLKVIQLVVLGEGQKILLGNISLDVMEEGRKIVL